MMRINFEHLENGIELNNSKSNILVVENSAIYAKIIFSLYRREDEYLKIYDDNFKDIREKKLLVITNPLEYNFNDTHFKTIIYNHIINQITLNQDFKLNIEEHYQSIVRDIDRRLEDNNIEFAYREELELKDVLKLVGIKVNQDKITSIFEKVQTLITTLNEVNSDLLLVFVNLSALMTKEEFSAVIDQIDLNSQTVLLLENDENRLNGLSYRCFDNDFYLDTIC